MTYTQQRTIILLLGLIALTVIGGVMWIRGVEPIETSATIFFIPVFAAVVFFGIPGGLTVAALASIAYVVIRIPSIQAVGVEPLVGVIIARVAGYLAFGAVGGWATQALGASIEKLEKVDRVDDETSLSNARGFVEQVEAERSRVSRYDGVFSTVVVSVDGLDVDRRARADLMQSLGAHLSANVRTVDRITHARDEGVDLFAFVLPETGADGATVFVDKLEATLQAIIPGEQSFQTESASFPANQDGVNALVDRFRAISSREHPAAT